MLLCDEVVVDPARPNKLTIIGLTSHINWPPGLATALHLGKLVVLLILSDGHGEGTGRIEVQEELTGARVFGSAPQHISFIGKDPSRHYGVIFRMLDCRIPAPGAYVVQFMFEGERISEQTLIVR
jgi:hypothetical protein